MSARVRDLLDRVASALEAGELPTVQDAADLELLYLEYRDKDKDLKELGLVNRVADRQPVERLSKEELLSCINHLVGRRKSDSGELFAALIRRYLDGTITSSDLFGERERKPRNDKGWQYRDRCGELAEWVHRQLIQSEVHLLTGNRSLHDLTDRNLYDMLADLPSKPVDKIRKRFKIPARVDLETMKEKIGCIRLSSSQWRDCHREFQGF